MIAQFVLIFSYLSHSSALTFASDKAIFFNATRYDKIDMFRISPMKIDLSYSHNPKLFCIELGNQPLHV